jgi:hypothetical protein
MNRPGFPLPMLGRLPALGAILIVVVSGCIAPASAPLDQASLPVGVPALVNLLPEREGFEVEVPVPVVLIGFDDSVATALQEELTPASVDHDFLDADNTISDPGSLVGNPFPLYTNPALPEAVYQVRALPAAQAQAVLDFILTTEVEGTDTTHYDGRMLEDHLAQLLQPNPDTPAFVILHGGDTLAAEHHWRYTYETGWLDRVRIFGGKEALVVLDASAQPDPYVVRTSTSPLTPINQAVFGAPDPPAAYNMPLERSGADVVEALAQAATDAAHFRLVQGPIYPVPVRECHTVLAYVGVRATALAHRLGMSDPADNVDLATLEAGFENLTGGDVTVQLRVVQLPHEDPVLDAATRNDLNYDLFRTWADMNWGSFFEDDGCEHYLSTLVYTDSAENIHGIALMDVDRNRRISFSWVDDKTRLREEEGAPLGGAPLLGGRAASREVSRWGTFLLSHETGHLFGQTHPHNAIRDADTEGERAPAGFTWAFSATWDAMSYQAMDRVADFGKVAQANHDRNRAGFAIGMAMAQGLEGSPELGQALQHLRMHHWELAVDALLPVLEL